MPADQALPHSEALELSAPEMAAAAAPSPPARPHITARHRRLSIIPMPGEQKKERGAGDKDTAGEEHLPEDNGAGADPTPSKRVNVVSAVGYTSKAGVERTGHKKTNQDAFVVLQVSQLAAPDR